ncbi:MAG: nitrous oxide reductase family maturation protein NosD [Candidatus Thorarchaeota archaeon]
MKHAQAFLFGILLTIVLMTAVSDTAISNNEMMNNPPRIEFINAYDEFGPIDIVGDTAFENAASNYEWDGEGSIDFPYIIENYNITSSTACIQIQDVSLYFIIRGCLLNETTYRNENGILLVNVSHARIEDTTITRKFYGIYADDTPNLVIDNCTIFDNWRGISSTSSNYVEINGCEIYFHQNSGIYISGDSNYTTISDNFIYSNNNIGVYASYAYNSTIENNTIYDNDLSPECGINLWEVDFWEIFDNHIFENTYAGIQIGNSDFVDIHDNEIHNNTIHGITLVGSRNCTVTDNEVYQNRGDGGVRCGISVSASQDCEIRNNEIYNNTWNGIYVDGSDFILVVDNHLYNNTQHGISVEFSDNCTILSNEIHGNRGESDEGCGISLANTNFIKILENEVYNNTQDGIFIGSSLFCEVKDNNVYENFRFGLHGVFAHNLTVYNNSIHDNLDSGIYNYMSDNWTVTWNVLYDNQEYGIFLINTDDCELYYNDIGWNVAGNALDTAIDTNYWNKSTIGNWWSDYVGTGSYVIPGAGSGVDYYPTVSLNMTPADSTGYEFTSTGHLMPWWSQALNPWKYEALRNGTQYAAGDWPGTLFDVPIDGFPVGVHNVTVILYHVSGHFIWNQSIVEVEDTVGPAWITEPVDQHAEFGESFSYQISATDPSGIQSYWLSVGANDLFAIDSSGLITNTTNLDTADAYEFGVYAEDIYSNYILKMITITVSDTVSPSFSETPDDLEFEESTTGNELVWVVSDYNLGGYRIYVNGTEIANQTISAVSFSITLSVDDLSPAVYNVTVLVYDDYLNFEKDTVWVTVTESTTTTTTSTTTSTDTTTGTDTELPPDPLLPLVLSVGFGGAIVVVVIAIIVTKKKTG